MAVELMERDAGVRVQGAAVAGAGRGPCTVPTTGRGPARVVDGRLEAIGAHRPGAHRPGAHRPGAGRPGADHPGARAVRALAHGPLAPSRPRPGPDVYRRRRLLAAGLLLLSIAAALILVQLVQAGIGGGPLTTTGAAAAPALIPAGATEYVVRPGDTLWTIAAALEPGADPRPLVDRLASEVGGASLYPGEVIALPAAR